LLYILTSEISWLFTEGSKIDKLTLTLISDRKNFSLVLALVAIPVTNASSISQEIFFLKNRCELFKAGLISVSVIAHVSELYESVSNKSS
jgi:hypothetical protein